MSTINPYQDLETRRQYRNHTNTQNKNISEMKEGLIVNSLIKDSKDDKSVNIEDMFDSLVIPDKTTKPDTFEKKDKSSADKPLHRSLIPLLASTVGLFGLLAGSMVGLRKAAVLKTSLKPWQTIQEITKHVSVNDEPHFATLLMIRDPNYRNIMGAMGVFVLSAIGLVGKNYVDGIKEIWVRKKQADVQRDLQERLIEVETKSFSGKMQILRNILKEKAKDLNSVLQKDSFGNENTTFKKFVSFKNALTPVQEKSDKNNNWLAIASVVASTVLMALFGKIAFKNVQQTAKISQEYGDKLLQEFSNVVKNSKDVTQQDLESLKNIIVSLNMKTAQIKEFLKEAKNLPQAEYRAFNGRVYKNYQDYVIKEAEKLTDEGAEAIAGKPASKPVLFSYTGDDRSHLYNMIVNPENPLLKLVFAGLATVTGVSYIGTATVEGMKEVQVIRENANTELDLQKRLVSVELKNFESKKRSVIEPMMQEYNIQARNGKDKQELKTRAENILYEIKNGPPFVYS